MSAQPFDLAASAFDRAVQTQQAATEAARLAWLELVRAYFATYQLAVDTVELERSHALGGDGQPYPIFSVIGLRSSDEQQLGADAELLDGLADLISMYPVGAPPLVEPGSLYGTLKLVTTLK